MPHQGGDLELPPYTPLDESQALSNYLGEYLGNGSNDAVSSLRRFLEYCLCIDYRLLDRVPPLPGTEWRHWVRTARGMGTLNRYGRLPLADGGHELLSWTEYCDFYIARPSNTLGVPPWFTGVMIFLFPFTQNFRDRPSSLLFRFSLRGMGTLASKLAIDRDIIIDSVITCPVLKQELKEQNEREIKRWFTSLQSPTDFQLTPFAEEWEARYEGPRYRAVTNKVPDFPQRIVIWYRWLMSFRHWP